MKRSIEESQQEQEAPTSSNKKMKLQVANYHHIPFFSTLSESEQEAIFSFLHVGEVLMLSLTCKTMYHLVESFAKGRTFYLLDVGQNDREWNLSKALSACLDGVWITSRNDCSRLATYLAQNESNQLPDRIYISPQETSFKFDHLFGLFSMIIKDRRNWKRKRNRDNLSCSEKPIPMGGREHIILFRRTST